jgi:hypothetical protein
VLEYINVAIDNGLIYRWYYYSEGLEPPVGTFVSLCYSTVSETRRFYIKRKCINNGLINQPLKDLYTGTVDILNSNQTVPVVIERRDRVYHKKCKISTP